ncbi:hypothetical protein [Nitratifractor sp.]|uniref:hypothetical protein n=1 Tax=Nitratifractor sp. TaxID=2268144 RepID=UPI0025F29C4F|nr:hypothetical protein [Nitratifractor sp.]
MRSVVFLLLLLPLALSAQKPDTAECQSCAVNKKMIRCDYYVAGKAVKEKQSECENYARYLDRDGTHANAAWYYLLAGHPNEALRAARKAMAEGQTYAAEYAVFALRILGQGTDADRLQQQYADLIRKAGRFEQDRKILAKLYPPNLL